MIRHDRKCFQSFVSSLDWYYGRLLYYAPSWLFYYNEWEHWKRNWEKLPWPKNDGLTHKNAKRRVTNNWVIVCILFWYQTGKIISKFGKKHKGTYCKIMWFLRKATGTVLHNLELFFRGKKKIRTACVFFSKRIRPNGVIPYLATGKRNCLYWKNIRLESRLTTGSFFHLFRWRWPAEPGCCVVRFRTLCTQLFERFSYAKSVTNNSSIPKVRIAVRSSNFLHAGAILFPFTQKGKIISKFGKKHKSTYCKIMWFLRKATGTVLHNLEMLFRGKKIRSACVFFSKRIWPNSVIPYLATGKRNCLYRKIIRLESRLTTGSFFHLFRWRWPAEPGCCVVGFRTLCAHLFERFSDAKSVTNYSSIPKVRIAVRSSNFLQKQFFSPNVVINWRNFFHFIYCEQGASQTLPFTVYFSSTMYFGCFSLTFFDLLV